MKRLKLIVIVVATVYVATRIVQLVKTVKQERPFGPLDDVDNEPVGV
jgi:hypothetical protein